MRIYKPSKTAPYWADYTDENGKRRRRSTGCRQRDMALQKMNEWMRQAERARSGVITPAEASAIEHSTTPLERHLAEYEAALMARGTTRHAKETVNRCRRVAKDLRAASLRDLDRNRVDGWFTDHMNKGMGANTANHILVALRGWENWMCANGRLIGPGPTAGLRRFNDRVDRRHVRRALAKEEAGALIRAAGLRPLAELGRKTVKISGGKKRSNWTYAPLTPDNLEACATRAREKLPAPVTRRLLAEGKARALAYRAGLGSGFRAGELAAMKVRDFNPNAATFRLDAEADKARRGVEGHPIPPDLAADLAEWLLERKAKPNDRLFPVRVSIKAFNRDLAAAGIPKHDMRGRVLDVHALRMTFISWLLAAGVPLRTVQLLARHSDPKLTANIYTDPLLLDQIGAVKALPRLVSPTPDLPMKLPGKRPTTKSAEA